jgi:hypothetical protein
MILLPKALLMEIPAALLKLMQMQIACRRKPLANGRLLSKLRVKTWSLFENTAADSTAPCLCACNRK